MLRRIIVVAAVAAISVFWISGCKKSPSSASKPEQEVVKTQAEYDAEAKKDITKDNMASELEKMEKNVEQESGEQP